MAQAFIFDAGWIFFAAWGMVFLVVTVIAFGRDILEISQRQSGKTIKKLTTKDTKVHEGNLGKQIFLRLRVLRG